MINESVKNRIGEKKRINKKVNNTKYKIDNRKENLQRLIEKGTKIKKEIEELEKEIEEKREKKLFPIDKMVKYYMMPDDIWFNIFQICGGEFILKIRHTNQRFNKISNDVLSLGKSSTKLQIYKDILINYINKFYLSNTETKYYLTISLFNFFYKYPYIANCNIKFSNSFHDKIIEFIKISLYICNLVDDLPRDNTSLDI